MAVIRRIGGVFVQPDNPQFLEKELSAEDEVFSMDAIDPVALLAADRDWNSKFTTAPFDPSGEKLRFFPGGFTIWSGYPGAGKTTLLRQLACHLMKGTEYDPLSGRSVFVCSMEETPSKC